MRTMKFIGALAILLVTFAGQGGAQKRDENTRDIIVNVARMERRAAVIRDLVETRERCGEAVGRNAGGPGSVCDVYYEKVRQTSLDALVSPDLAAKLTANLTLKEVDQVKGYIAAAAYDAYEHGKTNRDASKR